MERTFKWQCAGPIKSFARDSESRNWTTVNFSTVALNLAQDPQGAVGRKCAAAALEALTDNSMNHQGWKGDQRMSAIALRQSAVYGCDFGVRTSALETQLDIELRVVGSDDVMGIQILKHGEQEQSAIDSRGGGERLLSDAMAATRRL